MYNLFVSGDINDWIGEPWVVDRSRCVRVGEYTSQEVQNLFGELDTEQIRKLCRLPSIFAYESIHNRDPHFGLIRDVTARADSVRIDYKLHSLDTFLTASQLNTMNFELGIREWELNRTHWAVKDVDLAAELSRKSITLPKWPGSSGPRINLTTHEFDVALSFPGEVREYVEEVAKHLERLIGSDRCFYDRNYTAQLARPSLDVFLQEIYKDRSRMVVVFSGSDYQRKDWCGIEFRAVREIINARQNDRVMFVRMDQGEVDGIFGHDGFIDAKVHTPEETAKFITERIDLLGT